MSQKLYHVCERDSISTHSRDISPSLETPNTTPFILVVPCVHQPLVLMIITSQHQMQRTDIQIEAYIWLHL